MAILKKKQFGKIIELAKNTEFMFVGKTKNFSIKNNRIKDYPKLLNNIIRHVLDNDASPIFQHRKSTPNGDVLVYSSS